MQTTCIARLKWHLFLFDDERPGGIRAKAPGKGTGKGKVGDDEAKGLRGKCKVALRKFEKEVLVRRTEMAKSEHHLLKLIVSTAGTQLGTGWSADARMQDLQNEPLQTTPHLMHLRGIFPIKSPSLNSSLRPGAASSYSLLALCIGEPIRPLQVPWPSASLGSGAFGVATLLCPVLLHLWLEQEEVGPWHFSCPSRPSCS